MKDAPAHICHGVVVHKRLRPKPHSMHYRVFSLLLDVDRIDEVARQTRFFARNRFAPVSFYDRDHGAGDGENVAHHARDVLRQAGLADGVTRILLLTYPRVFGYVFNPLSVYFAFNQTGELTALVYEVSNTFKERMSYVVPAGKPAQVASSPAADETPSRRVYAQTCAKSLFVSPFAAQDGQYGFHVTHPDDDILVGVNFRDQAGPLIKTHFKAHAVEMTSATLMTALLRRPALTFKVITAIHYEAAKLFFKGVPLVRGRSSPRFSVRYAEDKT